MKKIAIVVCLVLLLTNAASAGLVLVASNVAFSVTDKIELYIEGKGLFKTFPLDSKIEVYYLPDGTTISFLNPGLDEYPRIGLRETYRISSEELTVLVSQLLK